MEIIYYELDSYMSKQLDDSVAAIGFFDGIHLGHKQLLDKAKKEAEKLNMKSAMITFSPSPASVLSQQEESLLSTMSDRIKLAEHYNMDTFIVLKFNKKFSQLDSELFYEKVLKNLNIKHLVCGDDFRYGHMGKGSVETLKDIEEIGLSVIKDFKYDNERISTTLIKENIINGDLEVANTMLGYNYFITGYVKHGRKKGRTIGFPTLNLDYQPSKVLVKDGVYVGMTEINGKNYISTINIGHNPTVNTMVNTSIESFVHHYNEDTYNQKVTFSFLKRLRAELKFDNVEQLITQMNQDIQDSEDYFTNDLRKELNIETI